MWPRFLDVSKYNLQFYNHNTTTKNSLPACYDDNLECCLSCTKSDDQMAFNVNCTKRVIAKMCFLGMISIHFGENATNKFIQICLFFH